MQWTRDSAFRFFPLVRHEELGLVLHPFDLATNKVLALAGRLEIRDRIDVTRATSEFSLWDTWYGRLVGRTQASALSRS